LVVVVAGFFARLLLTVDRGDERLQLDRPPASRASRT
jgi:hypothetical protein